MKRPIAIIDLETTGTDPVKDKICQFAGIKVNADLSERGDSRNILINPGIPMPSGARSVHGITDDMLKDKCSFESHALSIFLFLEHCDIAGFGITRFDVPLLSEELARCGKTWPTPGTRFLDAEIIFKRMFRRTLSAAVEQYCGVPHEDAHDGMADASAALMVIKSQMRQHPEVNTIDTYSSACMNARALDFAGKLIIDDDGDAVFNFGRHVGKKAKANLPYLQWMLEDSFPANTKMVVRELIEQHQHTDHEHR